MAAEAAVEAEGASGGTSVRIFVGGLAEGVSAADLEAMFGSIGRVAGVEFVRTNGRSFAYVNFLCPTDKALLKLFSTYNGCKWKGGKLRLEKAKEHYLARLKREWEQGAAAEAAEEMPADGGAENQKEMVVKPDKATLESTKINIFFPKSRKVKALPFKGSGKHKYSFRHIEVPPYPIHFCDCEEHCGPPEAANEEYASALNAVAYEKERNIMSSVMSKLLDKEKENCDSGNDMQMEETKETHEVDYDPQMEETDSEDDLDDPQMEETEVPSEDDLDDPQMEETEEPSDEEDDLVLNIVTRKSNKSVAQLNREKQAVDKDSFRKRQQFEKSSPQKKRQKFDDFPEHRNMNESTLMGAAIQNEQKSLGMSGIGTHEFSSKLDSDKTPASVQGVEALTGSSTKNVSEQNILAGEPKRGTSWTQKSAWRDLVGGMGSTSFSLSQILPNTDTAPPKVPNAGETSVSRADKRKARAVEKSFNPSEAATLVSPPPEHKMPSSMAMSSSGTAVGSAGHDTMERKENDKVRKARVVPSFTVGEDCTFMRNAQSEMQWSKAKKVLTGIIKKGNENTGSSGGKGKPSARKGKPSARK